MNIKGFKKIKKRKRYIMNKSLKDIDMSNLMNLIEKDSINNWDDLCNKCSSLVKDAGMTNQEIDEIVKQCKKV